MAKVALEKSIEKSNIDIDINIDELTPCLRRLSDRSVVKISIVDVNPTKADFKGWLFDWSRPKKGYKVYALFTEGDSGIQGLVSIKEEKSFLSVKFGVAESAPFNNKQNRLFVQKEYLGVGSHLFSEAVKQSYVFGYERFVNFEAKTNLIQYCRDLLGAEQIGVTSNMYIDDEAAKVLFEMYYGEK